VGRTVLGVVIAVLATGAALVTFIKLPFPLLPCLAISLAMVGACVWALGRFRLLDPESNSLRSLVAGMSAPIVAGSLGIYSYVTLTRTSSDRDSDFALRLSLTILAMALPGIIALVVAVLARRRGPLGPAGRTGIGLALASLLLTWVPINGLLSRQQQAENLALDVVAAPPFSTVDIQGETHRLEDHLGKVVLINIWATWCGPCRVEMPKLDALYESRKDDGLVVFGLSTEDASLQRTFAEENAVRYPLLTVEGDVPDTYSRTARYPANFIVDRQGRLRRAPSTDRPFADLEAMVDDLLAGEGPP